MPVRRKKKTSIKNVKKQTKAKKRETEPLDEYNHSLKETVYSRGLVEESTYSRGHDSKPGTVDRAHRKYP